jgi:DNA-binding PadR family transcriptional regulator
MATNRYRSLTPLALAVLTLLVERPMHPYEMQVLMRERGHDRVVKLRGASVYDTIERLQRLGLAEPVETNREGRRPERTVYRITPPGRREVQARLREMLSEPEWEYPQFGAALAFAGALAGTSEPLAQGLTAEALEEMMREVVALLERRTARLEEEVAAGDALLAAAVGQGVPRLFLIEEEYAQAMRRGELEWVRRLVEEFRHGDLWPSLEALMAQLPADAGGAERAGTEEVGG